MEIEPVEKKISLQSRDRALESIFGPSIDVFCLSGVLQALPVSCRVQGQVWQCNSFFYEIHIDTDSILRRAWNKVAFTGSQAFKYHF